MKLSSAFCGLLAGCGLLMAGSAHNPANAGSCIETMPGVVNCSGSGGSSTTIETMPGVYNTYGTDSSGRSYSNTIIETSPGVYSY